MPEDTSDTSLPDIRQEAFTFRASFKTVLLATSSLQAEPESSYAPFVLGEDDAVYIFISGLARHTQQLLENPQASLLWIENEDKARNLFARRRLSLQCEATELDRGEALSDQILDRMEQELNNTISVLRTLGDFHLFRLTPVRGVYVQGFGKAHDLVFSQER